MVIPIEISSDDYKHIWNMSMTVDEMDNTLMGRICCAIIRGRYQQKTRNIKTTEELYAENSQKE